MVLCHRVSVDTQSHMLWTQAQDAQGLLMSGHSQINAVHLEEIIIITFQSHSENLGKEKITFSPFENSVQFHLHCSLLKSV